MRKALLLLLFTAVLSGCFGNGSDRLSQDEAEDVARDAMAAFAADFSSIDGGDLRSVSGEFSAGAGQQAAELDMEWGREGTSRVGVTLGQGASATEAAIYCAQDRVVIVLADASLEARPRPGKACLDSVQDTGDPFDTDDFGDVPLDEVVPHDDGSIQASFQDEDGTMRVAIDAGGRVERIDIEGPSSSGFLVIEYGERRLIDMPDADDRMPLVLFAAGYFDGEAFRWSAPEGNESQPHDEFEIRVVDPESGETVAAFTPGQDAEAAGFTFTWDGDGDGGFGNGDAFAIEGAAWTQAGQYEVQVWDLWADREVDDVPVPGIGVLAILALAAVALLRR